MFLFVFFTVEPGIMMRNRYLDPQDTPYWGYSNLTEATWTDSSLWDPTFIGSFCPFETGRFRLILDGYSDSRYESLYSHYIFNGVESTTSRTTPYYELSSKGCYPYSMRPGIGKRSGTVSLYYQKEGEEQKLLTSEHSMKFFGYLCIHSDGFRVCSSVTDEFTVQTRRNSVLLGFILGLLLCE